MQKTKMNNPVKPTLNMYQFVQNVFDYFNEHLFEGSLEECLITLQREMNVMGYGNPPIFSRL